MITEELQNKKNFFSCAGVIFFLSYFPYTFLQQRYDTLGKSTKVLTSLLSNTGLSFGCQIISMWEGAGAGVQWSNLPDPASPDDNWSFLDVNIILFVDGILYLLLALYVEGVWPGDYGRSDFSYFSYNSYFIPFLSLIQVCQCLGISHSR